MFVSKICICDEIIERNEDMLKEIVKKCIEELCDLLNIFNY